ncbi:adenylyl cyclase [Cellulomonas sp. McL0617]|uniref:adenylyl cyclase n=1 Tax=Cellulomonas sp. McL0617 TaxID=3415675 RepID=UPI003CE7F620
MTGHRRLAFAAVGATVALVLVPLVSAPAEAHGVTPPVDLGVNTIVFDPSQPIADIQAKVDQIAAQQVDAQFGDARYSILFKPGTYGTPEQPLRFQVGYFTEVAGLGQNPGDVVINGAIEVYDRCYPTAPGAPTDCTALNNFWRSLSNLSIHYAAGNADGCHASANFWATSQAVSIRRVSLTGAQLSLMDYCGAPPNYASGGFIADSQLPNVVSGSQQQWLTRNSSVAGWSNSVWNQVFSGVIGAPADDFGPGVPGPLTNKYTTLPTTPASKEKPYLFVDAKGAYNVFVPSAQTNSSGASWANGPTPGKALPLSGFYVAKPGDSAVKINAELARGKNLLFTPGVYHVNRTINVLHPNTVVLGMGLATIVPDNGVIGIQTLDVPGVDIAGLIFDAGTVNSPALLQLGTKISKLDGLGKRQFLSSASNPTAVQDVFFRIGGEHVGKATNSLVVNTNQTIVDHTWAWRADHGDGVGWTVNTADTGVLVNGNDVTATGLFSEHFQKYDVVWNGERGKTIFFQNEMPYDAPNQAAWQHDGILGYAAYKVNDKVKTHEAWGLGSYIYTNVDPTLHATQAFEVPVTPGVTLHHLLTISLNGAGTIDHVVNGIGEAVTPTVQGPAVVQQYP